MSVNARHYREQLYRLRAHPTSDELSNGFVDSRDSFITVYLSIVPFVLGEYLADNANSFVPSGLIFPTSYLLFWAVYYSYYRPGFLEEKLTTPKKWDMMAVPTILIGVTIWFVKVTVVELGHFILSGLFSSAPAPRPRGARATPRAIPLRRPNMGAGPAWHEGTRQAQEGTIFYTAAAAAARRSAGVGSRPRTAGFAATAEEEITRSFPHPPPLKPPTLPREISNALAILGLREGAGWDDIHRRYRQLAKQFHPDLHPEITGAGKRFMMYDAAYRRLLAVKGRYFSEAPLKK